MKVKTLDHIKELKGKKVFLRADLNVPITKGKISEDYKIERQMPTLRYLLNNGAKVVLASHLGQPDPGRPEKEHSLKPVALYLQKELTRNKVIMARDVVGFDAQTRSACLKNGQVLLLENLRYEAGEKQNSRELAGSLAKGIDHYINNAFAVSHRQHASVSAIMSCLPSWAGFLLAAEIENLEKIMHPRQPLVSILGGVKLSTKVPLIKKLAPMSDKILLGGALANNFLKARGFNTGRSLIEEDSLKFAKKFNSSKIILPLDLIVSSRSDGWRPQLKTVNRVGDGDHIFDIGPESIRAYSRYIKGAATLVWNGPLGMFENEHYKHGTLSVARSIAARSSGRAFGVAGGGETVAALRQTKMMEHMDWVSTGGGAMLAYLSRAKMPGLSGLVA